MVHELAGSQLRPAARGADDREAIPSSVLDEIWATGIIQSQADASARSATLNTLLLEELAIADESFAIAAAGSQSWSLISPLTFPRFAPPQSSRATVIAFRA